MADKSSTKEEENVVRGDADRIGRLRKPAKKDDQNKSEENYDNTVSHTFLLLDIDIMFDYQIN